MRRRTLLFVGLVVVAAAICIRLGFWQLSRLAERRATNALVAARLDSAVVGPAALPADTALARFRRVTLAGVYDFAHEVVLTGRARDGAPGVYFLTPLRLAGTDTAVIVNRGWVYAPDAATVDPARWREQGAVTVSGFVNSFAAPGAGSAILPGRVRAIRWADAAAVDSLLPYPMAAYYVIATSPATGPIDATPVRLTPPPLDEGSHFSYAVQWFSFATIALGGVGVMWWGSRRQGSRQRMVVPPAPWERWGQSR